MNENMEQINVTAQKGGSIKKYIAGAAALVAALGVCVGAASFSMNGGEPATVEMAVTDDAAVIADGDEAAQTENTALTEAEVTTILSRDADDAEGENAGCLKITVAADGKEQTVYAQPGSTVSEALDKAGIVLGEDDMMNIDADEKIKNGSVISVNRVKYVRGTKVRSIDYKTIYRDDDSIPEGDEKVLVEGSEGEVIVELLAKMVDGERTDIEVVGKEVSVEAVDRVVLRGTMEVESSDAADADDEDEDENEASSEENEDEAQNDNDEETEEAEEFSEVTYSAPDTNAVSMLEVPSWLELDENGIPKNCTGQFYGRSCAYTAKPDAKMSTGREVFQGYVAVDPDMIPYGTELYIIADDGEVYGYAIAADTGYSVRAGKIIVDLFMNEYDDCIQWGSKNVTIYVLN